MSFAIGSKKKPPEEEKKDAMQREEMSDFALVDSKKKKHTNLVAMRVSPYTSVGSFFFLSHLMQGIPKEKQGNGGGTLRKQNNLKQ